jgi:hypothetical protein
MEKLTPLAAAGSRRPPGKALILPPALFYNASNFFSEVIQVQRLLLSKRRKS